MLVRDRIAEVATQCCIALMYGYQIAQDIDWESSENPKVRSLALTTWDTPDLDADIE